jgi:hypothetical protein
VHVFSSESKRFLEQTLIDMFRNVEETVYSEIVTLHKDAKPKQHPMHSQDKHPPST